MAIDRNKVNIFVSSDTKELAVFPSDSLTMLFNDVNLIRKRLNFDILEPNGQRIKFGEYTVRDTGISPPTTPTTKDLSKVNIFVSDETKELAAFSVDELTTLFSDPNLVGKRLNFDVLEFNGQRIKFGEYTVRGTVVPPEPPVEGLLYNSDTDINWAWVQDQIDKTNVGKPEEEKIDHITINDILGDDSKPNSKYIRCNASGKPKFHLYPKDKSIVVEVAGGGNHGRIYIGVCNFDCVLEKESVLLTDGADNDSDKTNSRHQYRDVVDSSAPDTKVQGGLGNSWHRGEVGQKGEWVHGKSSGCSKSASITLKTGEPYRTRFTTKHDIANKKIYELSELEYPIGTGFRKVLEQTCTGAPDQFFNKAEFLEWSEFWLRVNTGSSVGKVKHRSIKLKAL